MTFLNNKNSYRIFLVVTFIALNILVLYAITSILAYLNEGADRSTMLHLEKETVNTYSPDIEWKSLENPGREMEKQTLATLEKHYLFSWYIKNNALKTNTAEGIEDYFTTNPRKNLDAIIKNNKLNKISIESTTLSHHAKLDFYSEDGQLVVFTDENVVEFQNVYQNKKLISSVKDTATYKVLMLLEDGFWRIRHCERMAKVADPAKANLTQKIFTVQGDQILKNNQPFTIKGINYYPKNSAWDMYGELFNLDTIAADFDIITKAKLNTIRIFVPYEDFGKAEVKPEKIEKLKKVLTLAKKKRLEVIVTLFDFYGDYSVNNWTLTQRHAETVVSSCKDFDNIISWDIKNEPDLDFESRGIQNVKPWLSVMIDVVKKAAPNHLVTIGYSSIKAGEILKDEVDVVSYHYYEHISLFDDKLKELQKATKKPLIMQEFGMSSNKGIWNWTGYTQEDQAEYHKSMQAIFKAKNLSFVSWTLYDFPQVPDAVAGKWPWIKSKQKQFGFIDYNGKHKLSFKYMNN